MASYSGLVRDDFMARHDYNCAETMLAAANESFGLGLTDRTLRVAAPFGGGMGHERACGALTGSLMALGVLRGTDVAHRDAELMHVRKVFVERFLEHFGSLDCAAIKASRRDEETGCQAVVSEAAALLEEVLAEADAAGAESSR